MKFWLFHLIAAALSQRVQTARVMVPMYVAETEQKAREEVEEHLLEQPQRVADLVSQFLSP